MKKKLNHCAACVLIESEGTGEVLSNIYDNTYPIKIYRGNLNLLGGGKDLLDISPSYVIRREIDEEFSPEKNTKLDVAYKRVLKNKDYNLPQMRKSASKEDISLIKSQILNGMVPFQDFIITIPDSEKDLKLKYRDILFNIFYSKLSKDAFNLIRRNLEEGRSLVNDGHLTITPLEGIISGNILTAWATGKALEAYFNESIPDPLGIGSEKIGKPRGSYKEYLDDFDFNVF